MTITDQIKIIDNKIKANQAPYDLDRLTAYLHCALVNYEKMTIWLVKIWDIDQVYLNKLNLSILHWVKFLIKD